MNDPQGICRECQGTHPTHRHLGRLVMADHNSPGSSYPCEGVGGTPQEILGSYFLNLGDENLRP